MKRIPTPTCIIMSFFVLLLFFTSCSKDSDLLADYISVDDKDNINLKILAEDYYVVSHNNSVVLEVLENDTFTQEEIVDIVETSTPQHGTVEVNEDNSVTYTPDETAAVEENVTDEFTYTTESTGNGTTTTGQGTVTVELAQHRAPVSGDKVYFVTTSGKSTNSGTSEANAWSIKQAFTAAKAGDIVYVKAGDYGNLELTIKNSGKSDAIISFYGYTNTPGDIVSANRSTFSFADYKAKGSKLDSNIMPLLQGSRTNSMGTGVGIKIDGANYIHIENFMIRHYENGIHARGNNNVFKNIVSADHGDFNPARSWPSAVDDMFLNLAGNGIWITNSKNVEVLNSIAINNGARGMAFANTDNSKLINSYVFADNNVNATDYYILFYDSHHNTIEGNYVERVGDLSHFGHGFCFKKESSYNTVRNNNSKNTGFETNNGVHHNTFIDCHIEGSDTPHSGGYEVGNGSNNNSFLRCSVNKGEGIVFADWVEGDGNNGFNNAGHDNTFTDCVVSNSTSHSGASVDFMWNTQTARLTSSAYNNTFIKCTFSGSDYLFKVDRVNSGNKFIDCTVKDIPKLRFSRYPVNESLALGVTFQNTTKVNIGFNLPGN